MISRQPDSLPFNRTQARRRTRRQRQAVLASFESLEARQLLAAEGIGGRARESLHPKQAIYIDSSVVGPAPIVLGHSIAADGSNAFVITTVASGVVEKLIDGSADQWADVSTPPRTSNPLALLENLNRRLIRSGDQLRWRSDAPVAGRERIFEILGWDSAAQPQSPEPAGLPTAPRDVSVSVNTGGSWRLPGRLLPAITRLTTR